MIKTLLALAYSLMLVGLSHGYEITFELDEEFEIRENVEALNIDEGLSLKLISAFDTRCPPGFECLSQGYVRLLRECK